MSEEISLAMHIAAWIGVWHVLVGGYLVFFAERSSILLLFVGIVKGLLGASVYLTIRRPPWLSGYAWYTSEILIPVTLTLLLLFSVLVTVAIWSAYDLDLPHRRLIHVLLGTNAENSEDDQE